MQSWEPEELAALGLRPPKPNEELIEVTQHDTFGSWQVQLWLAVRADRRADIEAIGSLRPPTHVVLRHVSTGRYHEAATKGTRGVLAETTESAYRDELLEFSRSARVRGCKPLPRLPKLNSWRGRRLRRALLRQPHRFEGSCLFWAEDLAVLKLLEQLGADTDDSGWMGIPLLVHAADRGFDDVVRFLVEERGHSPNARRENGGYSALHWAKELGSVRFLMERGADPAALTTSGDSVLAQQLRRDHVAIVDYLLSLGEERASRANLLHWLGTQPEMLRVLIAHGVRLDRPIQQRFGERHRPRALQRVLRTGLDDYQRCQEASERERSADRLVECVELMLESGVDPRVRDCSNLLPFHLVQDAIPDAGDSLRRRLDVILGAFDGAREDPPPTPECTCGLNL